MEWKENPKYKKNKFKTKMNSPNERQQNIDLNINYWAECQTDHTRNLNGERFLHL